MSYSIDVNILLYGSDKSSRFHESAQTFLKSCTRGTEPLYLTYVTLMSYLRMSTHPRIFTHPLTPDEALLNVTGLASRSHVRLISERPGFLDIFRDVTKDRTVRANLVPDAHLTALLRQHGVATLYTNNVGDFKRFDVLDVRNPLV